MNNFTYLSKYQNLHMDRANIESMKTINVVINSSLPSTSVPRLLYQYEHGYDYTPQFWGLWDIQYGPGLYSYVRRCYGYVTHNTGFGLVASFYYTVDSQYVNLWFLYEAYDPSLFSTVGTTLKFTGYVFANDRTTQDYIKKT